MLERLARARCAADCARRRYSGRRPRATRQPDAIGDRFASGLAASHALRHRPRRTDGGRRTSRTAAGPGNPCARNQESARGHPRSGAIAGEARCGPGDVAMTALITDEVDRIAQLIDRMQKLGREQPEPVAPLNLHSAIHRACDTVFAANGGDVTLREEFDPSLPPVLANEGALVQVLVNLIANARDACSGEAASPRSPFARASSAAWCSMSSAWAARSNSRSRSQVSDNGPGVDPAMADHIFEPFVSSKANGPRPRPRARPQTRARHGRTHHARTRRRCRTDPFPHPPADGTLGRGDIMKQGRAAGRRRRGDRHRHRRRARKRRVRSRPVRQRSAGRDSLLAERHLRRDADRRHADRRRRDRDARPRAERVIRTCRSSSCRRRTPSIRPCEQPGRERSNISPSRSISMNWPGRRDRQRGAVGVAGSIRATPAEGLPLVGRSPPMQEVYRMITRVLRNDLTVLILGESGTGKELVAEAIHQLGHRKAGPFIAVNTAAIPRELIESELFGHEKGAFTGAVNQVDRQVRTGQRRHPVPRRNRRHARRSADAAAASAAVRQIRRVGGREEIAVDVRIIAATNRDLGADDRRRRVPRRSLLPAQRRADPTSAAARAAGRHRRARPAFPRQAVAEGLPSRAAAPTSAVDMLAQQTWRGNVRELKNFVFRAGAAGPRRGDRRAVPFPVCSKQTLRRRAAVSPISTVR